ncbi:VOC family protein [Alteromonas pelagimontana]|uniref:VOC family protein n=1 Tax=Alteromonas pelagimontana TaxID=1858656 RepID=A0A6M4MF20_9ALTE|nr:VOC family protein [Alteromonas pelagimontana]QJR81689.1 VOC family protein [Alteromonas pelagimontana]
MLDHIFINTPDIARAISFYKKALSPLGIHFKLKYDGAEGPPDHPDLHGFGSENRVYFWLREGIAVPDMIHIGFVARSEKEVKAFHQAATAAGARSIEPPGPRLHYDPRYYAAKVCDLDGYTIEAVYKSWQHTS